MKVLNKMNDQVFKVRHNKAAQAAHEEALVESTILSYREEKGLPGRR